MVFFPRFRKMCVFRIWQWHGEVGCVGRVWVKGGGWCCLSVDDRRLPTQSQIDLKKHCGWVMARGYPAPHVDSRNTSPRSVCDCCPLAMQTFQFVLNIVAPFLWIFLLIFDFHSSMIYQRLMLSHFPFSLLHRMTLVSPCAETFCGFCHIVGNKTRGVCPTQSIPVAIETYTKPFRRLNENKSAILGRKQAKEKTGD